jgi:hypothetical protein
MHHVLDPGVVRLSFAAGLLSCVLSLSGCGLCRNEEIREVASPSGAKKAVVFIRECGATTGFSTHVSVLEWTDRLWNNAGNVFIADDNAGMAPSGQHGELDLAVHWASDQSLWIDYPSGARLFGKATSNQPVTVNGVTAYVKKRR